MVLISLSWFIKVISARSFSYWWLKNWGFWFPAAAAAAAKSLQSCLTLCDPIDGSPPGSPAPGILQAGTLVWVAFPSPVHESEKWKWSRSVVSDSSRPHGLQPTRLLHPWDFPGKSTGVGCHCLLRLIPWYSTFYLFIYLFLPYSAVIIKASNFC